MEDFVDAADTAGNQVFEVPEKGTAADEPGVDPAEVGFYSTVAQRVPERADSDDGDVDWTDEDGVDCSDDSDYEERVIPRQSIGKPVGTRFSAEEDKIILDYVKNRYLKDPRTYTRDLWVRASRADLEHLQRSHEALSRRFRTYLKPEFDKWRKSFLEGADDSESGESKMPPKPRQFSAEEDERILDYAKAAYLEDPLTDLARRALWRSASHSDLKHLSRNSRSLQTRFQVKLWPEFNAWRNAQLRERKGDVGPGADLSADGAGSAPLPSETDPERDDAAGFRKPDAQDPDAPGKPMEDVVHAADTGGLWRKEGTVADPAGVDAAEGVSYTTAAERFLKRDVAGGSPGDERKMPRRRLRSRDFSAETERFPTPNTDASESEEGQMPPRLRRKLSAEADHSALESAKAVVDAIEVGGGRQADSISECADLQEYNALKPTLLELKAILPRLRELNALLPRLRELNALLPRLRELNALLPRLQAVFWLVTT